jgi:8-oxo-dGTP pyrophosphatase MutT (NUDIX family)
MTLEQDDPIKSGGQQVAALCWRRAPMPEVLLVTSLRTRRWILPKGWPQAGLTLSQSAAREALEEAGIVGEIAAAPLGRYHYLKEKKDGSGMPCRVEVFPLLVTRQRRTWLEKGARDLLWLPADLAARKVAETGLRRILLAFARSAHAAA